MNYKEALIYATEKHSGQMRKGGEPYITHPMWIAEYLKEKGYGEEYQIAALFHDLLEDTTATEEEILELSDEKVLEAVKALTKSEDYIMSDYVAGIKANDIAFVVKGADRLHNLRSAICAGRLFVKQYVKESEEWYVELYKDLYPEIGEEVEKLKEYLK